MNKLAIKTSVTKSNCKITRYLLTLLFPFSALAQEVTVPWSTELNRSTVQIAVLYHDNASIATGFLAKYKNGGYLITAKHVLTGIEFGSLVDLEVHNGDNSIRNQLVAYFDPSPNSSDIAVFPLSADTPTEGFFEILDSVESHIGDPIIFTGYPTTLVLENSILINTVTETGQISPLVKRGYISGFDASSLTNNIFIFDAQSIPGFSGSPIFVWDRKRNSVRILGVMAGGYKANVRTISEGVELTYNDVFYQTSLSYGNGIGYAISIIDNYILKGIKP